MTARYVFRAYMVEIDFEAAVGKGVAATLSECICSAEIWIGADQVAHAWADWEVARLTTSFTATNVDAGPTCAVRSNGPPCSFGDA